MQRAFSDPRCLEHRAGFGFPERPERLERVLSSLRATSAELVDGGRHEERDRAIGAVHEAAYVERFRRSVERGDLLLDSSDNPLSTGTARAADAAVEAALNAADWVMEDTGRHAFVAVRPPGHHAERGLAMGFCFFNNIAVVARYVQRRYGLRRVAIYDFDVHHGNGTQHLFEDDPDVLYVSTHQCPFYPGTGAAAEQGRGAGEGTTVNVPLKAASGDEVYALAHAERVLPAIREFQPELLLISAGFDAWRDDPVGGMQVTRQGFLDWGRELGQAAAELTDGRLLSVLEGGYDLAALGGLVGTYMEGVGPTLA